MIRRKPACSLVISPAFCLRYASDCIDFCTHCCLAELGTNHVSLTIKTIFSQWLVVLRDGKKHARGQMEEVVRYEATG